MTAHLLPITLACRAYDRVQALFTGAVRPEGVALRTVDLPVEETFYRQFLHQEFDAAEFGMSLLLAQPDPATAPMVGVPAFVSRMFRHGCIFTNRDSGIDEPADLVGRRVGVPEYQMTAAIWIRGLLEDEYGVSPSNIHWRTGGLHQPGRRQKVALDIPNVEIQPIPPGATLDALLATGEIDAYIGARTPDSYSVPDGPTRRLFPNYADLEIDYYTRTGIFPIMHCVVVRRDVYEANRWLARSMFKAFGEAKQLAVDHLKSTVANHVSLPWLPSHVDLATQHFGADIWPYGLEENRVALGALERYAHTQGLLSPAVSIADYFAPELVAGFSI